MPPRIRHAGPIALAVKGIREGAQAQFQAEERERLRKYRMQLAELAEKKRQANMRRQMAAEQERGRMARQAMAGQQAMGRQAMAGQQDMARQAMQARREQMGQNAQMDRMREQQGVMAEREQADDARQMELEKQRHELDKQIKGFELSEPQRLKYDRYNTILNDLDNSPEADRLSPPQKEQVRNNALKELWGLSQTLTPDQKFKTPGEIAGGMIVPITAQNPQTNQNEPLLHADGTPRRGILTPTMRNGVPGHTLDLIDQEQQYKSASDLPARRIGRARTALAYRRGGIDVPVTPDVISAYNNHEDALNQNQKPHDTDVWTLWKWQRDKAAAEYEEEMRKRNSKMLPLLKDAKRDLEREREDAWIAEDPKNRSDKRFPDNLKVPFSHEEILNRIGRDHSSELDALGESWMPDILKDGARPPGVTTPDPSEGPIGTELPGQQQMPQGMPPQQGMPGMPQGMPGMQPPQGMPQGMPQEMGLPAQPQAPSMEDRLMGFAEYTNSDDPDMPLPQIMPTSQVPPTEQLAHNTDLVEMYTHWSAVMKESFGTNPRDWPQRGRDVLSGISDAILDETPPPAPEVEMPPEEEPSRRRFMRPSQSSELVEGLPPGGWGSHSENISVSEYRHLAALEEYPLRRSLDRMTPEQKTNIQKLAVSSQDERMVEALENPSWLKLGAEDEAKQAADRMEEMVRERGKPLAKWRKADREEFSVLSRKVGTEIGSFHGVRSGGSMSNPAVVARHIRAHLKQVSKWNATSEEESKSFMQKWAENMPVD